MVIGAVIILVVIVLGVLYFMGERNSNQALNDDLNAINAQSESDATADIEADLNATDIENVDYNLDEENYNAS